VTHALIPISRLLAAGRSPHSPVSIDGESALDWATFTAHVGRLCAVLGARGPGRWLIFTENTYAFAVALMAVWHSDSVAVIAPNGQEGTLSELSRGTHGLITESNRVTESVKSIDAIHGTGPTVSRWMRLDRAIPYLELLTSGSTGAAKTIPKTLANLEDEVAGLERQWGGLLGPREIFGTVSHQHIYGLLFRVLWPLSAGRIFRAQTYLHPQEMVARMADGGAGAIVTSPAHLSRLKDFSSIERMAARCRIIFSSGGPLDRATAAVLRDAFGMAPFEIFGSTETGGVAWRQQDSSDDSAAWTLFASVTASRDVGDGLLTVRSPFVSETNGEFTMADRVEFLADGRFILGARNDRTVKLGDKRLSLPEMEAALGGHAFVAQAALTVLDDATRARLGAAVVLTPSGREALARQGRRAVSHTLLESLEPYWDRILLPKVWRYVNRLPEDAQGKLTVSGLRVLFATPYDSAVDAPELLAERGSNGTRQQTLRVPDTLGYLDGHFPDFPVVPGVVQIQWVMEVARAMAGGEIAIDRIEALKFKDILRPGDVFQLSAEMSASNDRLVFRLWNEQSIFSSGRCILSRASAGVP
jgi:acyl-coenzyme A synthetase/AMP-(fatty) acid ligase/3-hydroxymyristoyl/3-hydroxydecanoyl-(acyl carrier protein) dehydratase